VADIRVVVVELEQLQRLIAEAVRIATAQPSNANEWVDARTSGLGPRTFRRLAREGAFPASKRGKAYVARRADVDAYLDRQRIAPKRAPSPPEPSPAPPPDGAPFDPIAAALAEGRLRIVRKPP
jgi:hypothetical protein